MLHTTMPDFHKTPAKTSRARQSAWALKVMGLIQGGNTAAAIAQIKVAPTVKDLRALQKMLDALSTSSPSAAPRWPDVRAAVADNLALLSAPRLHRAP